MKFKYYIGRIRTVPSFGTAYVAETVVSPLPLWVQHPVRAAGRPPDPVGIGRHHMDSFVWIRVVTPEWEYTERLA